MGPISTAIEVAGLREVAAACAVSYQAVRKWEAAGRLPRTEWTGETNYAETIERVTGGQVTVAQLRAKGYSATERRARRPGVGGRAPGDPRLREPRGTYRKRGAGSGKPGPKPGRRKKAA